MNLPPPLEACIRSVFDRIGNSNTEKLTCRSVAGGSINQAASVTAGESTLFVKWNDARRYPGMFEAEAKGLALLRNPGGAMVPKVVETGVTASVAYLVMEYVEIGEENVQSAQKFGEMLAALHRNTAPAFGLGHDNYMGSLPQVNSAHDTWNDFFIHQRLVPQLRLARDEGNLTIKESGAFDRLFKRLPEIIPEESPALVHGDLWCGNYISGIGANTWLIDPAVAYAHREVDIAMSKLFGGFPAQFYEAYHRHFPLQQGWEKRIEIFQLYPLLIHVNLFGGGYIHTVQSIIKRFA